jgi:hypothetical protein
MDSESMEFYLHGKDKLPEVITALEHETLRAVLSRLEALPREGEVVFVGEAKEALDKPDEAEDDLAPANIDGTMKSLRISELRHVHTRTIHRIEVTVHFNGSRKRKFSPTATVATVLGWAKKVFKIDPADGADLVLQLRPSKEQPRSDVHLGQLLTPGETTLEFDLVREVTPQG